MSPNYSLLSSAHHENSAIRRVSNISNLYLDRSSFAISEQGKSGCSEQQERGESTPKRFDEDSAIQYVKVSVIGDAGVGKTAIVETFVNTAFPTEHVKTRHKREYSPSLILDTSIFELKIADIPAITHFPATTEDEWEHFRFFGLRSANAYILVFDVSRPESFQYISNIREQIVSTRDTSQLPILVVATKSDLIQNLTPEQIRFRQEASSQIRKYWKLNYVECSAKYNYNITHTFKVLAQELKLAQENRPGERNSRSSTRKCCFHCIP